MSEPRPTHSCGNHTTPVRVGLPPSIDRRCPLCWEASLDAATAREDALRADNARLRDRLRGLLVRGDLAQSVVAWIDEALDADPAGTAAWLQAHYVPRAEHEAALGKLVNTQMDLVSATALGHRAADAADARPTWDEVREMVELAAEDGISAALHHVEDGAAPEDVRALVYVRPAWFRSRVVAIADTIITGARTPTDGGTDG